MQPVRCRPGQACLSEDRRGGNARGETTGAFHGSRELSNVLACSGGLCVWNGLAGVHPHERTGLLALQVSKPIIG